MQASQKGILTPDTAHAVRQCLDPPNSESDSQLPAAAAGPYPVEAIFFIPEAGNGLSTMTTTKTGLASLQREGGRSDR